MYLSDEWICIISDIKKGTEKEKDKKKKLFLSELMFSYDVDSLKIKNDLIQNRSAHTHLKNFIP